MIPLELTTFLIFVIVLIALWMLFKWKTNRPPYPLPPGPPYPLPFIGHLHHMSLDPRKKFNTWRKKYGDIFSFYLGSRLVIVMSSYSILKEAFVKHGELFSNRPFLFTLYQLTLNRGVILSSGDQWKEQRKASLEILRMFGFGKNILAEKIQAEVVKYIQAMELEKGQCFDPSHFTRTSVANIINSIVLGKHFEYGDPEFEQYLKAVDENMRLLGREASMLNIFPFMYYLPLIREAFHWSTIIRNKNLMDSFFKSILKDHQDKFNASFALDYVSAYIGEMKKKETAKESTTLNDDNLIQCIGDFFVAGMETTSSALLWALVFFLHNPKVQEKCYQEIVENVGTDRLPTLHDKHVLPYMEALTMEVLRKANIVPFGVQHAVSEDLVFRGYLIPKDAILLPSLDSVLSDQDIWQDPENFRPERFLSEEGHCIHPEGFIPFSLGRRSCLGESLARMELFLFLSAMLQRFQFLPAIEEQLPSLDGILGLTLSPQHFKIRAVIRK